VRRLVAALQIHLDFSGDRIVLISLLYELLLFVLALIMLPYLLFQLIVKKKYRGSILQKLGIGFPKVDKKGGPLLWIHAISLGETKAIAPLVKMLKSQENPPTILFSNVTETGHTEALKIVQADYHVYLPFDFGWIINRIVKRVSPEMVILCESDFWYNFLRTSKKLGASVVLVNGKISERSLHRFLKVPTLSRRLFTLIDLLCVQNQLYGDRFQRLGVSKEKVVVTGNIKFDAVYPKAPADNLKELRHHFGLAESDPVIVMGSSHSPEELIFIQTLEKVWKKYPNVKGIVVPRHPERFNEVAALLEKHNIAFHRFSQKGTPANQPRVILVDAMGQLLLCYQIAKIAIVAGSYVERIGGHNILEPVWYGVPVLFGPHMQNQPDMVDLMRDYDAGIQVSSEALPGVIEDLLGDEKRCKKLGINGLRLFSDIHGATAKTFALLKEKMNEKKHV